MEKYGAFTEETYYEHDSYDTDNPFRSTYEKLHEFDSEEKLVDFLTDIERYNKSSYSKKKITRVIKFRDMTLTTEIKVSIT